MEIGTLMLAAVLSVVTYIEGINALCYTDPIADHVPRTAMKKNISSPNYPDLYPGNLTAQWCIVTNKYEGKIRIKVLYLDIEISDRCEKDNLAIYQQFHGTRSLVAKLCGHDGLEQNFELCCQAEVLFVSDNSTQGTGFLLEYSITYHTDDDDYRSERYTSRWGIVMAVICAVLVSGLLVTILVICVLNKRRKQSEPKTFNTITQET